MFGLGRSERMAYVRELQELHPDVICHPELASEQHRQSMGAPRFMSFTLKSLELNFLE